MSDAWTRGVSDHPRNPGDIRHTPGLAAFVDASPTPFHAVAEMVRLLQAAGFRSLDEREQWSVAPGDRRFVVRDGGTIAALRVGTQAPSDAGLALIGAHTDSPTLKVRPRPDVVRAGQHLLGVEVYGGPLLYTWLDRDLTLAGRVAVRRPDGGVDTTLVRLPGAPLRVPSLAIHLNRELGSEGLRLNPQQHMLPLWGLDGGQDLVGALAEHLGVTPDAVLGHDLVTADTQGAARGGAGDAWILAPRLDNLGSCYAGLCALLAAGDAPHTQVLVCNDHEEVGSRTAEGALGSFLADTLSRLVAAVEGGEPQALPRALARSVLVSSDAAHAVHPNYAERHEPAHRPLLGGGPVLKHNANQSYATDAGTAAWFAARCADAGVPVQHFVVRADMPCGSTIGPLTAARLGLPTVDVGMPLLSMHSCREQMAVADLDLMVAALQGHLEVAGG